MARQIFAYKWRNSGDEVSSMPGNVIKRIDGVFKEYGWHEVDRVRLPLGHFFYQDENSIRAISHATGEEVVYELPNRGAAVLRVYDSRAPAGPSISALLDLMGSKNLSDKNSDFLEEMIRCFTKLGLEIKGDRQSKPKKS